MFLRVPHCPALRKSGDSAKSGLVRWFEMRISFENWVPVFTHNWVIRVAQQQREGKSSKQKGLFEE